MTQGRKVGIRWTIGDVTPEGFEALRLAVWGGWKVFGPEAAYTVCVNSVPLEEARERTGRLPDGVRWLKASGRLPEWVLPHCDLDNMVEGKAWKFDPLQVYPDRWEISFDNDCILWEMPESIRAWLEAGDRERCLIAADVTPAHGQFARYAGDEPRNSGIRGIPPGFDFEGEMRALLRENPVVMSSELDEQGLQVAAASRRKPPVVVRVEEVAITSPFPPHLPGPGRYGAHFVGLNERSLPWDYYGRPATECLREHWQRHRDALYERVGIPSAAGR
ncbi:MAG TPA: hypothetical protein VGR37_11825 [Longimicrobiaceae bacterium]|nr:hypothetical protein [Longimicrobiaceae bacterium]